MKRKNYNIKTLAILYFLYICIKENLFPKKYLDTYVPYDLDYYPNELQDNIPTMIAGYVKKLLNTYELQDNLKVLGKNSLTVMYVDECVKRYHMTFDMFLSYRLKHASKYGNFADIVDKINELLAKAIEEKVLDNFIFGGDCKLLNIDYIASPIDKINLYKLAKRETNIQLHKYFALLKNIILITE